MEAIEEEQFPTVVHRGGFYYYLICNPWFSRPWKNSGFVQYAAIITPVLLMSESPTGCANRPSSKATASEEANRTLSCTLSF